MNVLLCPLSDGGYLYPTIAIGHELRRRGNAVYVLGRATAEPVLAHAGLPFLNADELGGHRGFSAIWWRNGSLAQFQAILRAAREVRPDLIVTSVLCIGALVAAEVLDIPVVVVGLAAHLWNYQAGAVDEPQALIGREFRTRFTVQAYRDLRTELGLAERRDPRPDQPLYGAALLLRGDPAFEYPGAVLPESLHHVGPLAWEPTADQAAAEAAMAQLDRVGKPVVYVHLHRFAGGVSQWPRLNALFTDGPLQAVVEQGRSRDPQPAPGADILLVRKPWMGPFIDRAELVLTSGTSAPVLGALLRGRPLGLWPEGSEQPVLAAACVRAGVAVYLADRPMTEQSRTITAAWQDPELRTRAGELGHRLARTDSPAHAADIIERVAGGQGNGGCRAVIDDAAVG